MSVFSDFDRAQEGPAEKSVNGYLLLLVRNAVSRRSKQQGLVAMSSKEAEFIELPMFFRNTTLASEVKYYRVSGKYLTYFNDQ